MTTKHTQTPTTTRSCKVCGKPTEQEKQPAGWYLCRQCLFNADSEFVPDKSPGVTGRKKEQGELFI
jgi:ribosomal protein S14